eukprot:TRINITY_DN1198_c0_g1_i1.p1 TRINITY_DN1198_c0_g1~~TRINITY_DN1198_c0_g1_i1.p1  ORF type:complete len:285 (-),score=50.50 TRINITY_DN1198_c0_g1_i1:171-1025(-)
MKVFVLLAFIGLIEGHTYLSNLIIDGSETAKCIRPQIPGNTGTNIYRNYPVNDKTTFPQGLLGGNMTCGFLPYAAGPASEKCSVQAGDEVGFQYWWEGPGDMIIDSSHIGPIMVYLAKSNTGTGDVWFKIYEDGYSNGKWGCPDNLKANDGKVTVTIPSDLAPGDYLVRTEIIALHDGDKPHGSQPYVSCAELTISGDGSAEPEGVSFPGAYKEDDPGIAFNLYQGSITNYPIPGPAVYKAGDPTPSGNGNGDDGNGLSGGAKFGIAIAVIASAGLAVAGTLDF